MEEQKEGGMETDGKEGSRGEGISQGAGPPASFPLHTGVWFTSPSLAMHLGPNGGRCQDELGQHGCREQLPPAERLIRSLTSCRTKVKTHPSASSSSHFVLKNSPKKVRRAASLSRGLFPCNSFYRCCSAPQPSCSHRDWQLM